MTLLAVRHLTSGRYHTRAELEAVTSGYNVPLVQPLPHKAGSAGALLEELRNIENLEGAVLWKNGQPLAKFKGEWYLQLHKLLGYFRFEKDIARQVLAGSTDDLMGILNAEKRAAVTEYQDALISGIKDVAKRCARIRDQIIAENIDRKSFAVEHNAPKALKALLFRHYDNLGKVDFVQDVTEKALSMTGSFGKWDGFKTSVGLSLDWDVDHLG